MIVCHCNSISDHEIHAAIDWMRAADPSTIINPGKIYHALGKSADCGGCMPLFLDTMRSNANLTVPANLCNLRASHREEKKNEGRSESHIISKQVSAS